MSVVKVRNYVIIVLQGDPYSDAVALLLTEFQVQDKLFFFSPLALQSQFGPWPTSMKLHVSLRFTRS
jgi:hypothetical protein